MARERGERERERKRERERGREKVGERGSEREREGGEREGERRERGEREGEREGGKGRERGRGGERERDGGSSCIISKKCQKVQWLFAVPSSCSRPFEHIVARLARMEEINIRGGHIATRTSRSGTVVPLSCCGLAVRLIAL